MNGCVVYLERDSTGVLIRRCRVVGPNVDRWWSAPLDEARVDDSASAAALMAAGAARWAAEQSRLVSGGIAAVCVDNTDALCSWLTAPSADAPVIQAAMEMAEARSSHEGDGTESSGALVAGLASRADATREVEALADEPVSASGGGAFALGTWRQRGAGTGTGLAARGSGRGGRYVVVSVNDSAVRVFLDELDREGVEVGAVTTLWHSMATAWDDERAEPGREVSGGANGAAGAMGAGTGVTAVVLMELSGRVSWCWSEGGKLLTAGTMRVRAIETASAREDREQEEEDRGTAAEGVELAREPRRVAEETGYEVTSAEVGRLVLDWLAFGAQIGRGPRRVVCVGPDGGGGLRMLGAGLARAWEGASVEVVVDADAVGTTLGRLSGSAIDAAELSGSARRGLRGLALRPTRAHRSLYRWGSAGVALCAAAVGVMGWRFRAAAAEMRGEIEALRQEQIEVFQGVSAQVPGIENSPWPVKDLETALLTEQRRTSGLSREMPVFETLLGILRAMEDVVSLEETEAAQVGVHKVQINSFTNVVVEVLAPESHTDVHLTINQRLVELCPDVNWSYTRPGDGSARGVTRPRPGDPRRVIKWDGTWRTPDRRPAGGSS